MLKLKPSVFLRLIIILFLVLIKIGILITCLFAGMRVTKRRLTAMQETAPGDQASSEPSDEDDDFFARKPNTSTAVTQLEEYLMSRSSETAAVTAQPLVCSSKQTLPCLLALRASACSVQLGTLSPH